MDLKIECDDIRIDTSHGNNQVKIELTNVDTDFINQLSVEDICINVNSQEELFDELMTFDCMPEVLHKYLEESGYIFNKA